MGTFSTKSKTSENHVNTNTNNASLRIYEQPSSGNGQETPQVVSLLSTILEKTIQKNDKYVKRARNKHIVTIFHGSKAPTLNIRQYMGRIFKYSKCSTSCFVVAYIYLDRFLQVTDSYLTTFNAHRLLITCVLLAAKFLDDETYNNAYYAKVGGVSTEEMNKLELKLLFSLDFRLHVTLDTFNHYSQLLEKAGAAAGSSTWQIDIERAIQACGLKGNWHNKDERKSTSKFATHTCRAI